MGGKKGGLHSTQLLFKSREIPTHVIFCSQCFVKTIILQGRVSENFNYNQKEINISHKFCHCFHLLKVKLVGLHKLTKFQGLSNAKEKAFTYI